ncbi:MAG TPA: hypothetical protein VJ953_11115 [Saprospiraceae bacterium]|nr:hypothetical protein [Saprospiraceae bacterium]
MGNNYDFHFNEPPLDPDRIEQHKDFAALMKQYQAEQSKGKSTGARVIWLGGITAIAAAIALLLIIRPFDQTVDTRELLAAQEAYFAEKELVSPPIPAADPAFIKQNISAESGGTYDLNAGLRMVIPERAFMDDRGREITGEVALEYREMHNPVDFFLSGVPMHFDSAGQRYQMESAGMIEVYGYQDGQAIQLAPGKTIRVELISSAFFSAEHGVLDFDLFYLDTLQGRWLRSSLPLDQEINYRSENSNSADDTPDRQRQLGILAEAEAERIAQLEQQMPMPVRPQNQYTKPPSRASFELNPANLGDLDEETRNILEDTDLSGAWWIAENQAYDQRVLQVGWPEMKLRYVADNLYEMSLIAGDSVVQLQIHPILIGPEQEEAQARYQAKLKSYQESLARWDAQLLQNKQAIQDSFALARAALYAERGEESGPSSLGKIVNRFEVDAFGVWNCDRLLEPGVLKVLEKLEDQTGKVYENHTAYMVDGQKNTIYRFFAGDKTLLEVPDSDQILIWILDEKEKIAFLPRRMNQAALTSTGLETLNLELEDSLIREPADLRVFLNQER